MTLPRFTILVTFSLYCVLLFAEYLRPGFVSNVMNVHGLLLVIAVCMMFSISDRSNTTNATNTVKDRAKRQFPAILIGIFLALILWHTGSIFGDFRLFFALAVGILPSVLMK